MTKPTVRDPQTVVLRSVDWVDDLAGELIRLGHPRQQARRSAVTCLQRILARSRWPAECYVVDSRAVVEEMK